MVQALALMLVKKISPIDQPVAPLKNFISAAKSTARHGLAIAGQDGPETGVNDGSNTVMVLAIIITGKLVGDTVGVELGL